MGARTEPDFPPGSSTVARTGPKDGVCWQRELMSTQGWDDTRLLVVPPTSVAQVEVTEASRKQAERKL